MEIYTIAHRPKIILTDVNIYDQKKNPRQQVIVFLIRFFLSFFYVFFFFKTIGCVPIFYFIFASFVVCFRSSGPSFVGINLLYLPALRICINILICISTNTKSETKPSHKIHMPKKKVYIYIVKYICRTRGLNEKIIISGNLHVIKVLQLSQHLYANSFLVGLKKDIIRIVFPITTEYSMWSHKLTFNFPVKDVSFFLSIG